MQSGFLFGFVPVIGGIYMRNSDLNVNTRRQNIVRLLKNSGRLTVKEISDAFGTSEITVRRDLDYLESQNMVERSRGSVTLRRGLFEDSPAFFDDKTILFTAEKERDRPRKGKRDQTGGAGQPF